MLFSHLQAPPFRPRVVLNMCHHVLLMSRRDTFFNKTDVLTLNVINFNFCCFLMLLFTSVSLQCSVWPEVSRSSSIVMVSSAFLEALLGVRSRGRRDGGR